MMIGVAIIRYVIFCSDFLSIKEHSMSHHVGKGDYYAFMIFFVVVIYNMSILPIKSVCVCILVLSLI
jgi:hypothetical protein